MTEPHDRYRQYLETLTPETLDSLGDYVSDNVRFADPFNDVTGVDAMLRVFRHMFETVGPVAFHVTHAACDGATCLMSWQFSATLRGKPWVFYGTSVIRFDTGGKVIEHIDHWDAAGAFYERLPVIGQLLTWLRGRLTVR
jgi:steroid delta-isomerase